MNICSNVIDFCDQSWIFGVMTSLQCHDPSDLLLKKHFWLLSMLKTVVLPNIFVETVIQDLQDLQKNRKFKRNLFEIEIFWNIINVFTVAFDQFNASLMNRSCLWMFKMSSFLNVLKVFSWLCEGNVPFYHFANVTFECSLKILKLVTFKKTLVKRSMNDVWMTFLCNNVLKHY